MIIGTTNAKSLRKTYCTKLCGLQLFLINHLQFDSIWFQQGIMMNVRMQQKVIFTGRPSEVLSYTGNQIN